MAERAHSRHTKSVAGWGIIIIPAKSCIKCICYKYSGLEQSEESYKEAVEALDKARMSWQTETETALDTFQVALS